LNIVLLLFTVWVRPTAAKQHKTSMSDLFTIFQLVLIPFDYFPYTQTNRNHPTNFYNLKSNWTVLFKHNALNQCQFIA
jgi:hypothetical protein